MTNRSHRWRTHSVNAVLSDEEHRALREICDLLRLTVRDVLLIGVRHANRIYATELARQRRQRDH